MSIRISVVVAVYNTGEYIEPLIDSLLRQTMPRDEYELIFIDDGSNDEVTPARLDRLAAQEQNVVVRHEPNSGWPGRPRNVGMDLARGQYVFFADHDDWFGLEALQRMADYADECRSDVLIPRYAGHRRGVAKAMFGRSQASATLESTPLMDSLTPHKLFRLEFLRAEGLRFPEGKRRLEDHVFVVDAYFRAKTVSVLADYHCYFHVGRPDAGNAAFNRIDPPSYYGYVREVIEIIYRHTEAGALRDRCLRRPLRQELLGRLDGPGFLAQPRDYQRSVFDECRRLAEELLPARLDVGLSPPQRLRAALLRDGRFDDLLAYVRHQVELRAGARLESLRWLPDGRFELELTGRLFDGRPDRPLRYRRDGEALMLTAPPLDPPVPVAVHEGTSPLRSGRLGVVIRRRENSEEWSLPTESTQVLDEDTSGAAARYRAVARFDPRTLAGGKPLTSGIWDFHVGISQTGWAKSVRLGEDRQPQAEAGVHERTLDGVSYRPYWTAGHGQLSLDVGGTLERPGGGRGAAAAGLGLRVVRRLLAGPAGPLLRRAANRLRELRRRLPRRWATRLGSTSHADLVRKANS